MLGGARSVPIDALLGDSGATTDVEQEEVISDILVSVVTEAFALWFDDSVDETLRWWLILRQLEEDCQGLPKILTLSIGYIHITGC